VIANNAQKIVCVRIVLLKGVTARKEKINMKRALVTIFIFFFFSEVAFAQPLCAPTSIIKDKLKELEESLVWVGLPPNNEKRPISIELYMNKKEGSWTIVIYNRLQKLSCVMHGGEGATFIESIAEDPPIIQNKDFQGPDGQ
tara:strand:- start:39 stop:464 length:426 start_codon:yes stop_codon:yes gene_type:complete